MRFARENYSMDLMREMVHLWPKHQMEVGTFRDMPIDPQFEVYESADHSNQLRIFTVRQSGGMVGYQIFWVHTHPHYRGEKQASQDLLYLDPNHRKGMAGYKFIVWCDNQLKAEGINLIVHTMRDGADLSSIYNRMGYEKSDTVYVRRAA
jgi:hypothetical protein